MMKKVYAAKRFLVYRVPATGRRVSRKHERLTWGSEHIFETIPKNKIDVYKLLNTCNMWCIIFVLRPTAVHVVFLTVQYSFIDI